MISWMRRMRRLDRSLVVGNSDVGKMVRLISALVAFQPGFAEIFHSSTSGTIYVFWLCLTTAAHFYGSKHMVPPRASDYSPAQLSTDPIFPSPPPSRFFPYKPSSDPIADPNARQAPTFDDSVTSADHGRFSLPMKGLKRNTRRIVEAGGIGGDIVQAVDAELRGWLEGTEVFISPETVAYNNAHNLNSGRKCICEVDTDHGRMQAVNQLAKQPHALVWQSEDSFTRFLIHAIARYYSVVSFSELFATYHHFCVY